MCILKLLLVLLLVVKIVELRSVRNNLTTSCPIKVLVEKTCGGMDGVSILLITRHCSGSLVNQNR
jgi:hypothetical protein